MNQEKVDAFNVVNQVCGEFKGNLEEHRKIQFALSVIKEMVDAKEPEKEEKEEENEEE